MAATSSSLSTVSSDAPTAPVPVKESKNSLISCAKASPAANGMNVLTWSNEFTGCDSAHSCPCNDFFNRYFLFQRHVFGRDDKKVCRVILTATEEAINKVSMKIAADGLILNLELTHKDGRSCTIEVEPRLTDQLCFSWPSLFLDLSRFTRTYKFVKASERHFMIFLEDEKEQ